MKASLFAVFLVFLCVIVSLNVAKAQWNPIKESGYAVTTNWHGIDVPMGAVVVATAGTKDSDVTHVEFIWRDPDNNTRWDENVTVIGPLTTPDVPPNVPQEVIDWANDTYGIVYWYAQSAHIPDALGEWGVQAIFHNATKPHGNSQVNFVIRSTSFNVIPDAPIVGTAGIIIVMLLGLGFYKHKRNTYAIN
jgi:hypothetical protein